MRVRASAAGADRDAAHPSASPGRSRRYPSRMRLSHLFFTTLRDDPSDAEMPSHRLLVRAGYVRQLGAGIYSLLPLGFRVAKRVEQVIREEMDRIGCQEMEMPVVHPADLWKETGRWYQIGPEMARFKDRGGRDMVLAMTHEEVVASLLADLVKSYRQLPMMVYHFQTKWRDEPRSRGGLIRVREFVMKDSYTCDLDEGGLDVAYEKHYEAYTRIFERLGLRAIAVASDVGMMGGIRGPRVHGPQRVRRGRPGPVRDVRLLGQPPGGEGPRSPSRRRPSALPLEEVATPGTTTIADLAAFLGISPEETAKATFFVDGDGRLITAIVRGDMEVNETKLANATGARALRPAQVEEIKAAGMEPGYGSPIGARGAFVVVDELVARSSNLVAGANREGFHYRNVNVGRDYTPDLVADLANAREGDGCPTCGSPVILRNGIEVGNIFKLGTKYTSALGRDVPRRGRHGPPDRDGLVRDRRRAARWPASSRPTTTRRGSPGRPRWRRTPPTW